MEALVSLARAKGSALLVVTHDEEMAARADRCVRIRDGAIDEPMTAGLSNHGSGRSPA